MLHVTRVHVTLPAVAQSFRLGFYLLYTGRVEAMAMMNRALVLRVETASPPPPSPLYPPSPTC